MGTYTPDDSDLEQDLERELRGGTVRGKSTPRSGARGTTVSTPFPAINLIQPRRGNKSRGLSDTDEDGESDIPRGPARRGSKKVAIGGLTDPLPTEPVNSGSVPANVGGPGAISIDHVYPTSRHSPTPVAEDSRWIDFEGYIKGISFNQEGVATITFYVEPNFDSEMMAMKNQAGITLIIRAERV